MQARVIKTIQVLIYGVTLICETLEVFEQRDCFKYKAP